jgi:hypothetical protein
MLFVETGFQSNLTLFKLDVNFVVPIVNGAILTVHYFCLTRSGAAVGEGRAFCLQV